MNHAAIEGTVTSFLSHIGKCGQCRNNPYDLCGIGARMLDGIGMTMPESPTIHMDVKFTPDERQGAPIGTNPPRDIFSHKGLFDK